MAEEGQVEAFMQVTQADRAVAEQALVACNGDLNHAIGLYYQGAFDTGAANAAPPVAQAPAGGQEEVRAPMRTGYTDNLMGNLETPADLERQAREKARQEELERLQQEKEAQEKLERDYEESKRIAREEAAKRKADQDAQDDALEIARKAAAEKKARRKAEAAAAAAAAAGAEAEAQTAAAVVNEPQTSSTEMKRDAPPAVSSSGSSAAAVPPAAPAPTPAATPAPAPAPDSATTPLGSTSGAFEAANVQKEVAAGIKQLMGYKDQNPSGLRKCLETLYKIVDNLDKKGFEDKFRKISLSSTTYQTNIAPFKGGLEVLVACGFREDEGSASLIADLSVYKKKGLSISGAIDKLDLVLRQLPPN